MNIAIAGTGYVGLANAILLAQHHHVTAVDLVQDKVDAINARKSPLVDAEIEDYLKHKDLDLTATTDGESAYAQADYVIVSTPTNYDPVKNYFDTSSVESVVRLVMQVNPNAIIVVKSTVPVGFTLGLREKLGCENLIFSPEFLREGRALYDNLYPSRIIVGAPLDDPRLKQAAETFAGLLAEGAEKKDIPILITNPTEAEAVKPTPPSATAATACPRTPSSCGPTMTRCPTTSSPPSWTPTTPARTSLPSGSWRRRATMAPTERGEMVPPASPAWWVCTA